MKVKFIFCFISIIFSSCSNHKMHETIIESFPIEGNLNAQIIKIKPVAMNPSYILNTGNYLILYNPQKDTLFDVFKLPSLTWIYNKGIKGQGPNDFLELEKRSFTSTPYGFKVFSQYDQKIKEILISDSTLLINDKNSIKYNIDEIPVNGLLSVNDSTIIYWGNIDSKNEYILHNNNSKKEFSPYPHWDKKSNKNEPPIFKYVKNSTLNQDHSKYISFYGYFKRLRIYNNDGTMIKDILVKKEPFKDEIKENLNERIIYYYSPPQIANDYIYILCKNSTREENINPELQIWDWDGNPIACYQMDHQISLFTISTIYNKIYAIDGENEGNIYIYDLLHR